MTHGESELVLGSPLCILRHGEIARVTHSSGDSSENKDLVWFAEQCIIGTLSS